MPTHSQPQLRPALLLAAALLCALAYASPAFAQAQAPSTVSGRITDGERGVFGVTVALYVNDPTQRFRTLARTKTDAEGRYLLTNVAPGRYQVLPVAPASIVAGLGMNFPPGRPLTIVPGEEIKDIDFKMEPGGVITGRVTDADGNAVVGEVVMAQPIEEGVGPSRISFDMRDQMTDDRGVYRLFGLLPGRYRVSVGNVGDAGAVSIARRKLFRRTFYPDADEQAEARPVEVKSGIEATDIDIKVGRPLKTYRVAGRFVMADTGQPVAGLNVGYSTLDARGRRTGGYGPGTQTNARGEFVTDGLAPGRYAVYVTNNFMSQEGTDFYSDPVTFEVADADVSGLVVKVRRGATVSGVVTIEGVPDRAAAAQMLSGMRVYIWMDAAPQAVSPGPVRPINVNPDGTFTVKGVPPGKIRLGTLNDAMKSLSTTRIELNGQNVISGFNVTEGAQVTGVHVVMTYGTATIVGQTTYLNGAPPTNARVMAFARLVTPTPGNVGNHSGEVDGRGYFRIEGLPAGEYEVYVTFFDFGGARAGVRPPRSAPLRVVVGDGVETKVTPTLDFK